MSYETPSFMDLNMLVVAGSDERAVPVLRALVAAADFALTTIAPTSYSPRLIGGMPT